MKTVIIVNGDTFGKGDESLGKLLLGAFLRKLWAYGEKPETIVFYNSGVKCLLKGSSLLDALHGLADQGVELVACGTCIDHYSESKEIEVGRRSDMVEIVSIMMESDKTITV